MASARTPALPCTLLHASPCCRQACREAQLLTLRACRHINNITERNYVKVQAGRRVVPTELGITLIRGYQLIDPDLASPQALPGSRCPALDTCT